MKNIHVKHIGQIYITERNKEIKSRIEKTDMAGMKLSTKVGQILDEVFGDGDIVFLDKILKNKGYVIKKISENN